jgi:prolyl-tRNA editing enzyme YbaK/EbsC (Cys-tRNA(Pro) deacylase)
MTVQTEVLAQLKALGIEYEVLDCDPALADTAQFCKHYGYSLDVSANTIVVASKRPVGLFVACLVLASTRLDVNGKVREITGWKKASFARPEQTAELTGMTIGGVTPFALPEGVRMLVDSAVMNQPWVIVGAGSRSAKLRVEPASFGRIESCEVVDGLAVRVSD